MNFSLFLIALVLCTGLNVLAFAVFSYDKFRAKMKTGRSPENFLLVVATIGPVGALIAMIVFRHKTRHIKFYLVPVFFFLHLLLFVWLMPQIAG